MKPFLQRLAGGARRVAKAAAMFHVKPSIAGSELPLTLGEGGTKRRVQVAAGTLLPSQRADRGLGRFHVKHQPPVYIDDRALG